MVLRHKFGAKRCSVGEIKFPSKLEARYYQKLKELERAGEVVMFLRQVPFDLPGASGKYFCDFCVFYANGLVEFIDTKGFDTDISKLKRKLVESTYPVSIKIVTKI
jgi:hypothetical protein